MPARVDEVRFIKEEGRVRDTSSDEASGNLEMEESGVGLPGDSSSVESKVLRSNGRRGIGRKRGGPSSAMSG